MKTKLLFLALAVTAGFSASTASANPWKGTPAGFKALHHNGHEAKAHCSSCEKCTPHSDHAFTSNTRWGVLHTHSKGH